MKPVTQARSHNFQMLTTIALLAFVQEPGRKVLVLPKDLPRIGATTSKITTPKLVSRPAGSTLKLPKGFKATVYARGLKAPRWMCVTPNGDVLVVECNRNRISLLVDKNKDGVAEKPTEFASGLNLPFGIAIRNNHVYIANTGNVIRYPYQPGQTKVSGKPEIIIANIPQRGYNMHWTRNLIFSPDQSTMYLTVGSETNKDIEESPRGTILKLNPDGSGQKVFADGLRNPVGLAFQPGTNKLWTTCVERDFMGDDLVPDFITSVEEGDFFGWPWFYIGKNRDPQHAKKNAPTKAVKIPDVLTIAHSVPLGIHFYTGNMFPAEYKGDAFVAMRGSTNRRLRSGYEVVRIRFQNGKLVPGYETFISGWTTDRKKREVYGRPVGLVQMPDGSMLLTDEGAGLVYRITYSKP